MRRVNNRFILFVLFFVFNLTIIFIFSNYSSAQTDEFNYSTSHKFDILEFAEGSNSSQNLNTIALDLPSNDRWNLTNLEMNFTDIEFEREIFIGENNSQNTDDDDISKNSAEDALAIQMKLESKTKIFGAYIYGRVGLIDPGDIMYFQIQGCNSATNTPNGTILVQENLKITNELKWHYQNFSLPKILPEGNYFLVINRSKIQTGGYSYSWEYNYNDPKFPDLYRSIHYSSGGWLSYNESTFLYKLDQKKIDQFYPSDLNMSVKIKNDVYPVENTTTIATGKLNLTQINYASNNGNPIAIEVFNDVSSKLLFNISYYAKFSKNLHSLGTSIIKESGEYINWTVEPDIISCNCNNSIRFDYPINWENIKIFKNTNDVSENCTIDTINRYIVIPDNLIEVAAWEIKAISEKIDFSITFGSLTLEPQQDLQFSVSPTSEGNITFILYDSDGFLEYQETKVEQSADTPFSYQLPSNPLKGIYKGYIIWNNATDAGIQIQEFQITVPFTLDPMIIVTIVVGSIVGIAVSIGTYQVYKREKAKKEKHRQKIYNKYMDILNLQYILIIDKKSGLEVYQQKFAGKEMNATLVSGFLEAMRSFGIELTNTQELAQTIKLDFQKSKILMSEFKNFRLILIMSEDPSVDFLESIKDLSLSIEKYYGESIRQFQGGKIKQFEGIRDLIDEHLNTTLTYPLKINEKIHMKKLSSEEKLLVKRAKNIITEQTDYFFITYLIGKRGKFSVADAENILKLIKKRVFLPYQKEIL